MRVAAKAFWLPKAGSAPDEYEDAFWPTGLPNVEASLVRFAVADGATETSFSGLWAKLLAKAYWRGWFKGPDPREHLERLRSAWHQSLNGKPLPWYAEEKMRMGAFSSLVGLTLTVPPGIDQDYGKWSAMAIGDSCLFHVRDGTMLTAFPLQHSKQFDSRPLLLSTNPRTDEGVLRQIARKEGEWKPGDLFYLMTDALACWLLRRQEDDAKGLVGLSDLQTQERFAEFIQCEREEVDADDHPWLRNDDVTLFRVEVS